MTHVSIDANSSTKSRLALLGVLGHLDRERLHYDIASLRSLVEELEPDLLGIELEPEAWQQSDLANASAEVREALLPAARRTATVIVPLGSFSPEKLKPPEHGRPAGWRAALVRCLDWLLDRLERTVQGPDGVNTGVFHHLCHLLCCLQETASSPERQYAWEASNERILERLLWIVRRDPGRRVLAAVHCRRLYWLQARLRQMNAEFSLVPYADL